ncbi:MAG TPA: creatininase family protein [Acetobacteraceae bacterium]
MQKFRFGELTGGEMRELAATNPVVLLPLGSHEDQGPHAPMGDYLSAERVAVLIAERATEAGQRTLVAPVLPFGGADYFGTMPGGIALGQATLRAVLTDMFACLLRHGLTRLIVINGHGGNVGAIHEVTQEIYRARRLLIPSFYLWRVAYTYLPGILGEDAAKRAAGHGADPLTSVAMQLFPELMRPDMIPPAPAAPQKLGLPVSGLGTIRFEGADMAVPLELDEMAPNGVWAGDPSLCSAATGAVLVEKLVELGARFVRHMVAQGG